MVLENMVSGEEAEKNPWHVFIYTIIATTVSLFISARIFPSDTSIAFLFLVTIASMPMIYRVLADEEAEDESYEKIDFGFLSIHKKAFIVYSYIFLGVLVASSFWYTVLPESYVSSAFSEQIKTYERIRGDIVDMNAGADTKIDVYVDDNSNANTSRNAAPNSNSGMAVSAGSINDFSAILENNVSVAFISLLLSFFYGVGAVFILAWNASVVAVFVGVMSRYAAAQVDHPLGAIYGYLTMMPSGVLSISLHGVPEMAAYFIAGIAGGILSIGIRRNHNGRILKDAFALFGFSVALLIAAAFIEVWVTPNL